MRFCQFFCRYTHCTGPSDVHVAAQVHGRKTQQNHAERPSMLQNWAAFPHAVCKHASQDAMQKSDRRYAIMAVSWWVAAFMVLLCEYSTWTSDTCCSTNGSQLQRLDRTCIAYYAGRGTCRKFNSINTVWLHLCSIPTPGSTPGHRTHAFVTVQFQPARPLGVCPVAAPSSPIFWGPSFCVSTQALQFSCGLQCAAPPHRAAQGCYAAHPCAAQSPQRTEYGGMSGLAQLVLMGFEKAATSGDSLHSSKQKSWAGLRRAVFESAFVGLVVAAQN